MLWLALHFPDWPLQIRTLPGKDASAIVVAERIGRRRLIVACDAVACAKGVATGMDVTTALLQCPQLQVLSRTPRAERNALQALCGWAEQFSGDICMDAERALIWLEAGRSLRYFGGVTTFTQQIQQSLQALGYTASFSMAPTLEAAALLAVHAHGKCFTTARECQTFIDAQPLHCLALDLAVIQTLRDLGWTRIGEANALPADQLARRFGPALPEYLRRLAGREPDPRPRVRSPATWQRQLDFDDVIHSSEVLLFPLRRLLLELQGYLRGRDTALQALTLQLLHRKSPATTLVLNTTAPQREAAHLFMLLRERLEQMTWPEAVCGLRLQVTQFVSLGDTQLSLFADTQKRDQGWSELIDKLTARLGANAVRRLGLANDHLPEKAWCVLTQDQQASQNKVAESLPNHYPERPLWLLAPRLLAQLPSLLGKPERIECGWWQDDQRRDYYFARTAEGSRWWLYRDADSLQWYLHGIWA